MNYISKRVKKVLSHDESLLIVALLVVLAGLSILSPYFFSVNNIVNVLRQSSITLIAGVGMTLLLLVGDVDLSIGSLSAFIGVILVKVLNLTNNIFIAFSVALLIGVIAGLINGLIVTKFNINSLIVTLGMMSIYRGISYIMTNAVAVQTSSKFLKVIGTGYLGPIPIPTLIAAIIFIILFFLLKYFSFGRYVYAAGSNPKAAAASGINVRNIRIIAFVICSVTAALSSIILTSRVNSGQPNLALGFEMTVIAATILGGTSLAGGQGSLLGTLIGILLLGFLENGMVLLNVSSFYQDVVRGAVIILAVLLDTRRTATKDKALKKQAALSSK